MNDTIYHGGAVNRGGPGIRESPPTARLSGAARDIVRLLEGTDGQARVSEIAARLSGVARAEINGAVQNLADAGIVTIDSASEEPVVRLRHPFTEALESVPKMD